MVDVKTILKKSDIPIKHGRLIISEIKNIAYEKLFFSEKDIFLNDKEEIVFFEKLSRYKKQEPLSKIINKKAFWKDVFFVNKDVLDPRQETELFIENVISRFHKNSVIKFLDIGTGSGCILLSLLREFPKALGVGIDISEKAIEVAKHNKVLLKSETATFLNISWNDFADVTDTKFDVIVSNPPYVKSSDIMKLDRNVRCYDPIIALDGGYDGLNSYREIIKISKKLLLQNGILFLETGYDQAESVKNILLDNDFNVLDVIKDFNEINRLVVSQIASTY